MPLIPQCPAQAGYSCLNSAFQVDAGSHKPLLSAGIEFSAGTGRNGFYFWHYLYVLRGLTV